MDFVHGVSTSRVKTMMERQMDMHVSKMAREGGYLTWEETLPGKGRCQKYISLLSNADLSSRQPQLHKYYFTPPLYHYSCSS